MRVILLCVLAVNLAFCNLIGISNQCPEQFVPDTNSVCIRPSYI